VGWNTITPATFTDLSIGLAKKAKRNIHAHRLLPYPSGLPVFGRTRAALCLMDAV
jgi:hypothetical protein